jgi:NAD(P)-dependent dehydrogenase (short-subunit alcohol dehydrogenase family)
MELSGVTALVTGGADGIGAGIAERLAAEGMYVVIADLDDRQGPITAERVGGSFVRTDLADRAGVHAAVDAAGPVGVLVNNAGGSEEPYFPTAEPAMWERALDLNLRAVMLATQLVLGPMRERGGGAIINIASTAGLGRASHDSPEYAVAKAGVVRFTACLAPLRDTMAVRASCICPGLVDAPVAEPYDASRTRRPAAGAVARRYRRRGDGIPGRRYPARADHAVPPRRRATPAAFRHRRAGVSGPGWPRSCGRGRSAAPPRRAAR